MVEASIRIALGEKPDVKPRYNKGSAIRYLKTIKGVISNISGIEKTNVIDGIVQVSVVHGVGEKVGEIKSSIDRVGFVIAQSESAEKAVSLAEQALNLISIEVQS